MYFPVSEPNISGVKYGTLLFNAKASLNATF
jgi:hypothetical protein